MADKKLISFVVPVLNEEPNIAPMHAALSEVMNGLASKYDFEIVFTDNHSSDATFAAIRAIGAQDPRIRAYRFSRNFGYQKSILTGYRKARGAAAIQLDCDLQDPPALIPAFLEEWEKGAAVVYGVRKSRKESGGITLVRQIFYRLIDVLSEEKLPHDAGDFRLLDRKILDQLQELEDQQPYLRGTIASLGYHQVGIEYDRAARQRGKTKFSVSALFGLAVDGILNHSIMPLRFASYVGITVSLLTILSIFGYGIGRFVFGADWPRGFATTTVLLLGSISLNALFLGIIGEYLGRIYQQVKPRPISIIEEKLER